MNQDTPELTIEDNVKQVMQTLPPVIKAYITGGKYTAVAQKLMAKYNLRIDQAGVLERELMLLLMGIDTPDELTEALASEAKLEQQTVNSIIRDLNDEVFVPLREEEESKGFDTGSAGSARPVATPVPAPVKKFPPITPRGNGLGETLRSILPAPLAPAPTRKALETEKYQANTLLEDHEEPHIEFKKESVSSPAAAPLPPLNLLDPRARVVAPPTNRVMPRPQIVPPQNLPGAMPAIAVPTPAKVPLQPQPLPPRPTPPPAPAPAITSYTTDPYREPIDDAPGA